MMYMTDQWVDRLDRIDELSMMIHQSTLFHEYKEAKIAVEADEQLQKRINDFVRMKERYEEVQRFGKYHPDFNEVTTAIREQKRVLDKNEKIARFQRAEEAMQLLLDEITVKIAAAVSPAVKVDSGNPFFQQSSVQSCSAGGCSIGGACNCSA